MSNLLPEVIDPAFQRWYDAIESAGAFHVEKFRRQARESGVYHAARNARKQGTPLSVALLMLRAAV